MQKEKIFYNAVWGALGCDHRETAKLKSTSDTWEEAFKRLNRLTKIDPETEWKKLEKFSINLILSDEKNFPEILREIYWPPFGIYFKGNPEILNSRTVAIVGTRKATEDGVEISRRFGTELARTGLVIASGLAFGIDSAAHKGCLGAKGKTIAVLACGLDEIYPRTNIRLAEEILNSDGAIISEYAPGIPPLPHRFIERNRIVSGLSLGVVVIEAPESSGSLATARFASEQNREVFVVPGPAGHRNFSGSHRLIRNGARLVSTPSDVLEDLEITEPPGEIFPGETPEEKIILKIIENSPEPVEVDKIIEIANLESRIVNQVLTLLLLKKVIEEKNEGYALIE